MNSKSKSPSQRQHNASNGRHAMIIFRGKIRLKFVFYIVVFCLKQFLGAAGACRLGIERPWLSAKNSELIKPPGGLTPRVGATLF